MGTAMNNTWRRSRRWLTLGPVMALLAASLGGAQELAAPVKVTIKDGKLVAPEAAVDPKPRIDARYAGGMMFGLFVEGTRITCTPESSVMHLARIDNQVVQPGFDPMTGQPSPQQPLPPGPFGKKRLGTQTRWVMN